VPPELEYKLKVQVVSESVNRDLWPCPGTSSAPSSEVRAPLNRPSASGKLTDASSLSLGIEETKEKRCILFTCKRIRILAIVTNVMEIDDEISKLKKEKAAAEDALQAFKKKTKVFFDQKTKQVEVLTITLIQSNDIDLVACL
jgi:hypothetical protein